MDKLIDQLKNGDTDIWLLLFAAYCIVTGCYALFYCIRISRWPSVIGVFIQKEIAVWSSSAVTSDNNYFVQISYLFKVDGKEYRGHRLSPFIIIASHNLRFLLRLQMKHVDISDDGKVRVFYNPRRPEKSYLIPPSATGYIIIISFMFLPLIAYLFY
jgi:hypothetical protein